MKFILGLLIGGGLVFGWYYMHGVETPALTSEKAKIRADYEVQLKAAEDRVENLNKELLQIRSDLVTAKVANTVETVYVSPRLEQTESKSVVVTVPVRPAPQSVSVPQQSVPVAPVKSGLGGPRPVAGGARVRQ